MLKGLPPNSPLLYHRSMPAQTSHTPANPNTGAGTLAPAGTPSDTPSHTPQHDKHPNTADGGGWCCTVKLALSHDDRHQPLAPLPPEQPFCTVYDKAMVPQCVRAAQAVLVNPTAVRRHPHGAAAFVPVAPSVQLPQASGRTAVQHAAPSAAAVGPSEAAHDIAAQDQQQQQSQQQRQALALGLPASPLELVEGRVPPELPFTYNKVVLEISGAEADLTVIDLPGACSLKAAGGRGCCMWAACVPPDDN